MKELHRRTKLLTLGGAAIGIGAGLAAQHAVVRRRRLSDPEASEPITTRRGERTRMIGMPDGASLFLEEVGPETAEGVVFVNASALRTDQWHYQMTSFPGRRLVFYDQRGHGRSRGTGTEEFSVSTLARDLERVLDDCGLQRAVLVGHSVGGSVVLELCDQHLDWLNDRIRGIVLCNTSARLSETTAAGTTAVQLDRMLKAPGSFFSGERSRYLDRLRRLVRPTDPAFLVTSYLAFGENPSAKHVDVTYDMVADTPSETILNLFRAYRSFDMWDVLGDINVPALVISGDRDRITVPSASEHLARELPKAQLVMMEGCGHMSMLERHEEFNTILSEFIAEHLG